MFWFSVWQVRKAKRTQKGDGGGTGGPHTHRTNIDSGGPEARWWKWGSHGALKRGLVGVISRLTRGKIDIINYFSHG